MRGDRFKEVIDENYEKLVFFASQAKEREPADLVQRIVLDVLGKRVWRKIAGNKKLDALAFLRRVIQNHAKNVHRKRRIDPLEHAITLEDAKAELAYDPRPVLDELIDRQIPCILL